jgi:hypothetical protein
LPTVGPRADVESLITTLPSVSLVEEMVEAAGLEDVASWTAIEEFDYESSEKFLGSPLISDFLMPIWLETLPRGSQEHVVKEIGRLINEERHEAEFALTVKATLVMGRKAPSQGGNPRSCQGQVMIAVYFSLSSFWASFSPSSKPSLKARLL